MPLEVVVDGTITQVQAWHSLPPSLKLLLKGEEGLKASVFPPFLMEMIRSRGWTSCDHVGGRAAALTGMLNQRFAGSDSQVPNRRTLSNWGAKCEWTFCCQCAHEWSCLPLHVGKNHIGVHENYKEWVRKGNRVKLLPNLIYTRWQAIILSQYLFLLLSCPPPPCVMASFSSPFLHSSFCWLHFLGVTCVTVTS